MDPTYVLLPGMIGTADLFRPFLAEAPPEIRTHVITYPTDVFLSYPLVLELIERELSNQQQIVLIGESYSGALALLYAAAHPQKVRAVILSGGYVSPPWPSWMRLLIRPFILRIHIPSFLIRYVAAGTAASDEFVNDVRTALAKPTPQVMVQRAREALAMDNRPALLQCRAPILYLAPTHDHLVRPTNVEEISSLRPEAKVEEIDGPHLILQTAPVQAWKAIQEFMRSAAQASGPLF